METPIEDTQDTAPETSIEDVTMDKAPETVNLVASITDEADQRKIASRVFKDYETDHRSSERYREKRASILKLFIGMLPPSQDDGAQIHYSIIAQAVIRIHARIYDQQFPSNGEFFGVRPTDNTDAERAIRVAKHMNWQVLHQIPEYVPNHDALIMQWLLYGSAFSYVYWGSVRNRPCHEVCATEDIILPYTRKSTDPNLADIPRITRILRLQRHELEAEAATGYYDQAQVEKLLEKMEAGNAGGSGEDSQKSSPIQETTDKAAGIEKQEDKDDDTKRVLIEQHRWLKLPGGDRERPVIVTIDRDSKILLQIRLREDEDQEDRARFNREQDANNAEYAAAMMQYQQDLAAYEMNMSELAMSQTSTPLPMQGAETMTAPPTPGETTSTGPMALPPPPPQPQPPPPPAPVKMVPVNFFTHYVCVPNPEGIYGYGIGFLLEGDNMVADTVASQYVDAGTLANTPTFVFSRQAKLGRGEFRIRPGHGTQTDLNPQDLDKGIKVLDFKFPNPAMMNVVKDAQQDATDVSGAGDILSGEVGGSNETATTTQIRISQALAAISIQNKRYTRARTCEAQKIARLNSVYLGDDEYFTVVDPFKKVPEAPNPVMGAPGITPPGMSSPGPAPVPGAPPIPGPPMPDPSVVKTPIARRDYLEDVDITITADPRMASQPQRVQEATQALNLILQGPLVNNLLLVVAAYRNLFIAMDRPDLVAALMAMPPMPPGPPPGQGPPPPNGKPSGGPPKPSPGPRVPNAGPTPANGPEMGQGA